MNNQPSSPQPLSMPHTSLLNQAAPQAKADGSEQEVRYKLELPVAAPPVGEMIAASSADSFGAPSQLPTKARVAVFVAHGMGQQARFETLARLVKKLLAQDQQAGAGGTPSDPNEAPTVVKLKTLDEPLHGFRVTFKGGHKVDIFEGYWAPLTEGAITLRNVITFLFSGVYTGLKNAFRPFRRFLFGEIYTHPNNPFVVAYLLAALGIVAALVVMNLAITMVSAGRLFAASAPRISPELITDLTTTFNCYVVAVSLYVISFVLAAYAAKRKPVRLIRRITTAMFYFVVLATITAGAGVATVLVRHARANNAKPHLWASLWGQPRVDAINRWVSYYLLLLLILFVLIRLIQMARNWLKKKDEATSETPDAQKAAQPNWKQRLLVYGLLLLGIVLASWVAWSLGTSDPSNSSGPTIRQLLLSKLSWLLLLVIGWVVRRLLVQYVGDVAIYVTPYSLDRFFALREQIRRRVSDAAQAVFAARDKDDETRLTYDQVFFVGHSLGSIAVYDALNRLINLDEIADQPSRLEIVKRTKLLLTFGSPLDKVTFLFERQIEQATDARAALAASAQPLIAHAAFRPFRWINIYSDQDIISGALDFFDPPQNAKPTGQDTVPARVQNVLDPETAIYVNAHTEYWENSLLYEILYGLLTGQEDKVA